MPSRARIRLHCLALLAAATLLAACSRPPAVEEPIRAVRTLTVAAAGVSNAVEYAAEVRAQTESRLAFRVPGKIASREVSLGDTVRAGQVLARLDPRDLLLGQDAARAALAAAQAQLAQSEADFDRFRELKAQGFISAAELERRETALKAARAQYQQATAQASTQGNQAAYAALLADASGVITAVEAEPGMVVAAGTPVLRLAHQGRRDVVFSVPEDQLELFKQLTRQGSELTVRLWSRPHAPLPARIRELAAAADPATRTYLVKAELPQADLSLGQTASVAVPLPGASSGIRLPLSALIESQGTSAVWVVDPASMTVDLRPVRIGGAQGNEVLVSEGLQPGQQVVTAGVHVLTRGQKVKFYQPEAAPANGAAAASAPRGN